MSGTNIQQYILPKGSVSNVQERDFTWPIRSWLSSSIFYQFRSKQKNNSPTDNLKENDKIDREKQDIIKHNGPDYSRWPQIFQITAKPIAK